MKTHVTPQGSELLPYIQAIDPVTIRPFLDVADRIGKSEFEVISGIRALIREKIVREFGPVFDPRHLGYVTTLVAVRIEKERATELAAAMLHINEITHNYYRDNEFNLWFTITAPDRPSIDLIIRWVEKFPGVTKVMDLPVERAFKISAVFDTASPLTHGRSGNQPFRPSADDRRLIRALQSCVPIIERPFLALGDEVEMSEETMISRINSWIASGVIRRFGARVSHNRMGFHSNMLIAWDGADVETWGIRFAELPAVSHCYLRSSYPEWPYRLYTMVHARSEEEMGKNVAFMRSIAEGARFIGLRTIYELKKTGMKYFLES